MRLFTSWRTWDDARPAVAEVLPTDTVAALDTAVAFALQWHGDQMRPTGVPYLEHLLEALEVLVRGADVHDENVLVAVILHDVVEDTECAIVDIVATFGSSVAELVDWVTKPPPRPGVDRADQTTTYLAELRDAPSQARLVKLADRVSNVQTLDRLPGRERRRAYYDQTVAYILPLAEPFPWFAAWYAHWRRAFAHLAAPPA